MTYAERQPRMAPIPPLRQPATAQAHSLLLVGISLPAEVEGELAASRCRLISCRTGGEAAGMLPNIPMPDLCLMAARLPDMEAAELVGWLRRQPNLADLALLVWERAANDGEGLRALQAGAQQWLPALLPPEMLKSQLQQWLHQQEKLRRLQTGQQLLTRAMATAEAVQYRFRTPDEAQGLALLLAGVFPEPERVREGLAALLLNAVEHGNLELGYAAKAEALRSGRWPERIAERLSETPFSERHAEVILQRRPEGLFMQITDEGKGFDPAPYLHIDPARAGDINGRGIACAQMISFDQLRYRLGGRQAIAVVRMPQPSTGAVPLPAAGGVRC